MEYKFLSSLYEAEFVTFEWPIVHELILHQLTYSMERSPPWEANRFSASQEILRILTNAKASYRTYTCPPHVPSLSQIDPVHVLKSHFLNIHLNVILTSTPGFSKWSFPSGYPTKPQYTPVLFPIRATCPSNLILLDFMTRTILGEEYISLSSPWCIFSNPL
jgi:hypothetical protein